MDPGIASGPSGSTAPRRTPLAIWLVGIGIAVAIVLLAVRGGGLGYRSVAEMAHKVPIGQDIDTVRIEIQNGTVGIDVSLDEGGPRLVDYAGGVRRAADTAEELARLEQIAFALAVVPAPEQPRKLVLRGPTLPPGSAGLLALELGIRIPGDLAIEIAIAGSGHVTVANRSGRTAVETGRGDLRFERCRGPVWAKTGRGMVIAFDHCGDLDIQTLVGDMQAFVKQPGALIRLVSGHGTVQCGVPADCEFDLDARAEIGRIGADFDLTAETVGSYGAALAATRGSARTKVVLRTGSGHLAFRVKKFD